MSEHSPVGASVYDRIEACPGSVRMCRGLSGRETEYSREGTAAHKLAEYCLTESESFDGVRTSPADLAERGFTINGIAVTDEMAEAVQTYLDVLTTELRPGDQFFVEHKFKLDKIHPDLWGTNDAAIYHSDTQTLCVFDYKHGAGKLVEVENNSQLKYYGLGACLQLNLPVKAVELCIVQPRCEHADGPVRRWQISPATLLDWADDLLNTVRRTEDPHAPLHAGDHCRWCPAAGICQEIAKVTKEIEVKDFNTLTSYDPADLATRLEQLDRLEAYAKALREFAYSEAVSGKPIPGYKVVDKRGTRKWVDDDQSTISDLTTIKALHMDDITERKLRSPAQVEKAIKAKLPGKENKDAREVALWFLADICETKSSGTVLVPESDKRAPAALPGFTGVEFEQLEG